MATINYTPGAYKNGVKQTTTPAPAPAKSNGGSSQGYAGASGLYFNTPEAAARSMSGASSPETKTPAYATNPNSRRYDPNAVNTNQPSPQNVNAGEGLPGDTTQAPNTVQYDAKTGAPLAPGQTTIDPLGNTYTQGQEFKRAFEQTKASGNTEAPITWGKAKVGMDKTVVKDQPTTSPLTTVIDTEPNFVKSILESYDEYFSPDNQKKTYLEEYKTISKSLGIEGINEKLLNLDRIIEGTEDDIRAEITASGGFSTDSQVLALANARNKTNIKNYNYLLEQRKFAMTQLDTMMNLTMEERKAAGDEFDRKLNFAFKVADFTQKASSDAKAQNMKLLETFGAQGVMSMLGGNTYETALFEKSIGLAPGGLANAPVSLKDQLLTEQIKTEKAQREKIYSDINKDNKTINNITSQYQQERSTRMLQGISQVRNKVTDKVTGRAARFQEFLSPVLRSNSYVDFAAELDALKANIFANELTAMREASKTGGAVGNASDREGARLESALGALNPTQSKDSILSNLKEAEDAIARWNSVLANKNLVVAPDGSGNLIEIVE